MGFSKLVAAGAVATTCIWYEGLPALAQSEALSRPVLKPAKARGTNPRAAAAEDAARAGSAPSQTIMQCVAGWYGTSGMTQGEWRKACQRTAAEQGVPQERALSLCVDAWEPATHMTKREWRTACQRSVQQQPGAFER